MVGPDLQEMPARATVLVVGDVIYDLYFSGVLRESASAPVFSGSSRRESASAPVFSGSSRRESASAPVFSGNSRHESLGGAAHVAAHLAALGNSVHLIGVVGSGAAGRRTREMLRERGIADTFVLEDLSRPTTQRTFLVADGRPVLRWDTEGRTPLSVPLIARLRECAEALFSQVNAVVCADSGKGVCIPALIDPLLAASRAAALPVFAGCAGHESECAREVITFLADVDPSVCTSGRPEAVRAWPEQSGAPAVLRWADLPICAP